MIERGSPPNAPLRSYGRIKARALKPRQAALLETLLPKIALPAEGAIEPGANAVLEIGFGGGEHLAAQAKAHPEMRFLGVEPFLNGVASCLRHLEEGGIENVRLHQGDARDVLARLPPKSLARIDILFPDPWPKARHHKRRLIQPDFLDLCATALREGAELRFATDWADYAAWTLALLRKDRRFAWLAERADDWRKPWPGHVKTRYEEKKLGDCAPIYLRFSRSNTV
ncbi:MAG: tRNA (guanosine(46)-N7)-methyltransferase TrmB [Hyphomonadaceae bacterium]